jgi:hypothetical protein
VVVDPGSEGTVVIVPGEQAQSGAGDAMIPLGAYVVIGSQTGAAIAAGMATTWS